MFLGLGRQQTDPLARPVDPQQGHKIGFSSSMIGPQRLSGDLLVTFSIQDIVGDLVGKAQVIGKSGQGVALGFARMADDGRRFHGIGNQGARLEALHTGDRVEVPGAVELQHVDHLTAHHAAGA